MIVRFAYPKENNRGDEGSGAQVLGGVAEGDGDV